MCNVICAENTQLSHTENIKLSQHLNLASLTDIKFSLCQAGRAGEGEPACWKSKVSEVFYYFITTCHVSGSSQYQAAATGYK